MSFLFSSEDNVDRLIGFHSATYSGTGGTTFQSVVVNPSTSYHSYVEAYWKLQGQSTWVKSPRATESRDPSPYLTAGLVSYNVETGVITVTGGNTGLTCQVRVFEYMPDTNQPKITIPNAPQELETLFSTQGVTYRKIAFTSTQSVTAGGGTFTSPPIPHGQTSIPYVSAWILSHRNGYWSIEPLQSLGAQTTLTSTDITFRSVLQDALVQTIYYRVYEP